MAAFDFEASPFVINPHYRFQWEEAQQCHVLLFPEGLIKLSGSAAEIMQRCQQQTTFAQLLEALNEAFPGVEGLAEDVKEFLKDAQQQQWIVASSD